MLHHELQKHNSKDIEEKLWLLLNFMRKYYVMVKIWGTGNRKVRKRYSHYFFY